MLKLHKTIESNSALLIFGIIVIASMGGLVQILPTIFMDNTAIKSSIKPYTALELTGRDIYIREGCVGCHSQQVRPFVAEVLRYGDRSSAAESIYDRPFLWGSKRTGPDLARVGGKYSNAWHKLHLIKPQSVVPNSIMPPYPWLDAPLDNSLIKNKLALLKDMGHPYSQSQIDNAQTELANKTQMDAIIVYLQSLGVR